MNEPQPNNRQQNKHQPGQSQPGKGRGQQRRQRRSKPSAPVDIWKDPPEIPATEPIVVPAEVDSLLRSLGEGPAIGGSTIADGYFVAVVERTAHRAAALARIADVLAQPEE